MEHSLCGKFKTKGFFLCSFVPLTNTFLIATARHNIQPFERKIGEGKGWPGSAERSTESGIFLFLSCILSNTFHAIGPTNVVDKIRVPQVQMSALSLQFMETPDFFETGGIRGLSEDEVEKLPKVQIAADESLDAAGDKISCSVCLQVYMLAIT